MNGINFDPSRGDNELAPYARELHVNDLVLRRRDMLPPPAPDETPPDETPRSLPNNAILHLEDQTARGISFALHFEGVRNPGFSIRAVQDIQEV